MNIKKLTIFNKNNQQLYNMKTSATLSLFSGFLKSFYTQFFLLIILLFSFNSNAQGPGCPNVNAGGDIELDCEQPCTDLSATFLQTGETTSYEVSPIDYEPPFPTTGGTEVSVFIDDRWSNIIPLPFDFCFYGDTYSQILIGSNGVISFDTVNNEPDGYCDWSFSESIPSPDLFGTTIFGPYMDIDPSVDSSGIINYTIFGDAPCRTMVVNFPDIPYYSSSCNQYTLTTQVVIYETTNVVEIYLEDRTNACSTWNDGNAVIGLQNQDGTDGITPPERNTGNWAANNEAWRFTPNGESNVAFSWLNEDNEVIGTDSVINVCPANETSTYTAQAIYTNCNGDVITETDTVTVTFTGAFGIDLGDDQDLCGQEEYLITAQLTDANPSEANFTWSNGETSQSITVTESNTYTVDVTVGNCTLSSSVTINFSDSPLIDLGGDQSICGSEDIILDATPSNSEDITNISYKWFKDGVELSDEILNTLDVMDVGIYSVEVSSDNCVSTDSVEVNLSSFTVTLGENLNICDQSSIEITPEIIGEDDSNASFVWSTGETTSTIDVSNSGTYSVTVTINGCENSDTIDISITNLPVVDLGDDFKSCVGESWTLTATSIEEGITFQWFLNGNEIPGETSNSLDFIVTEDFSGIQTYGVSVTKGDCTGIDEVEVQLYDVENCIITQGISPDATPGYNDYLDLEFLSDRVGGITNLQIFNRFGTIVYDQVNYINQWNGQDNAGNKLPTGTYYYVIDLASVDDVYRSQTSGWIYLNRKSN